MRDRLVCGIGLSSIKAVWFNEGTVSKRFENTAFGYMPLPFGHSSFEDFVEEDDNMEYIWKKPKEMDAVKKNEESRKPDLIDVLMEGVKTMEEFKEKNDPTHSNHYIQNGLSVWDVIKAYTEDLTGVDAFNAGNAIKYILRWHHKNGVEDLKKAKVYIDELIKSFEEKESEGK